MSKSIDDPSPAQLAARKKHSERIKQLWKDPNYRKACSNKHTPDMRNRISESLRKRTSAPDYVHNRAGCKASKVTRAKMSQAHKAFYANGGPHPMQGRHHTEAARQKMSEFRSKEAKTPEGRLRRVRACQAHYRKRPTESEQLIAKELRRLREHYRSQVIIGDRYVVDFVLIERSLIIECDGAPKPNKKRDRFLRAAGYCVVHILNRDVKNDVRAAVGGVCGA